MAFVDNLFKGIKQSIPDVARKIGTLFLFIFTLGMIFGYFIAFKSPVWLLVPFVAMIITYYKLDEGYLIFFLLLLAAIYL